jgi:CRISPR-associated protein Csd2
MCQNFYDIRTFGAVMTTGVNCGQVRGPVQLTFARSIDPVVPMDVTITRVTVTKPEDMQVVVDEEGAVSGKQTEMGRKAIVPYGLYRTHGFFNPHFAQQTRFSDEDLELFWQALQQMWDFDRSAARGMMACRGLYVFSHESALGNAPAHKLFERIDARLGDGVNVPRAFRDYEVHVDEQDLPAGVVLSRVVQ